MKIEKTKDYYLAENIFLSDFIVDLTGDSAIVMEDCSRVAYRSGWVASAGVVLGPEGLDWDAEWQVDWTRRSGRPADGISIGQDCADIQIAQNYIINCSANGLRLSSPRSVLVTGNVIHSNGRSERDSAAILADGSRGRPYDHLLITGNHCYNDPQFIHQGATASQSFGVRIAGSGRALMMLQNDLADPHHRAGAIIEREAVSEAVRDNIGGVIRVGAAAWPRRAILRYLIAETAWPRRLARKFLPAQLRARASLFMRTVFKR